MKSSGNPLLELIGGGTAFAVTLSVEAWAAVVVAAATAFALVPLGLMRWRAFFRNTPPPPKPEADEQP